MIIPFDETWQHVSGARSAKRSQSIWVGPIDNLRMAAQQEWTIVEKRMKLMVDDTTNIVGVEWEYRTRLENRIR